MTIGQGFMIGLECGAAVLFLLSYLIGWKRVASRRHARAQATGTVVGYTAYLAGDATPLAIFEYIVDGKAYRVEGPRFRSFRVKTVTSPISRNEAGIMGEFDPANPPQVLRIRQVRNAFVGITPYPLMQAYPTGSRWPVFYDPDRPKHAYAVRPCNEDFVFWTMFLSALLLAAFGIVCGVFF